MGRHIGITPSGEIPTPHLKLGSIVNDVTACSGNYEINVQNPIF